VALSPVRRELLRLLVGVALVDAIGIGVLRLTNLQAAGADARLAYTAVWMLATLAAVLPPLMRLRRLRRRPRSDGGR
jgi:hypothetical protein